MADVPVNELLKIAVQLMAKIATKPADIAHMVYVNASAKHLRAYNLCDGTKSQSEVATKVGLDSGNFSRTVARWVESGAVFRIGEGRDAKLLHLYPLTKDHLPKPGTKTARRNTGRRRRTTARRDTAARRRR